MKKIISLQILMLAGLALGSASMVAAYNGAMKYTNKSDKNCSKKHISTMVEIQDRLTVIKEEFKKNGDVAWANKQLDKIAAELPCVVAKMRRSKGAIRLWKTHKHTLERNLREVREFINRDVPATRSRRR